MRTTIKPPPPTPHENGSVTPSTPAAATAASTALPPSFSVSIAACVAISSTLAAAPPVPIEVGGPEPDPTSAEALATSRRAAAIVRKTTVQRSRSKRTTPELRLASPVENLCPCSRNTNTHRPDEVTARAGPVERAALGLGRRLEELLRPSVRATREVLPLPASLLDSRKGGLKMMRHPKSGPAGSAGLSFSSARRAPPRNSRRPAASSQPAVLARPPTRRPAARLSGGGLPARDDARTSEHDHADLDHTQSACGRGDLPALLPARSASLRIAEDLTRKATFVVETWSVGN